MNLQKKYANFHAYGLLIFATLCWGGNVLFGKLAVGEISPMALVTLRWFGVIILLALLLRRKIIINCRNLKAYWPFFLVISIFGFTGFNALIYSAAHSTTGLNIGVIQASIPIFVMIGAFLFQKTSITVMQIVGIVMTLTGVIIIVCAGDLRKLASLAFRSGDLLMLLASLFYASYTLSLRKHPDISALALFSMLAIFAFITSIPLLAIEISLGQFSTPSIKGLILLAAIIFLPSFLAQICFIKGVNLLGPSRAGIFINLVPIFGTIFVVLFLDESIQFFHWTALLFAFSGIYLSEYFRA